MKMIYNCEECPGTEYKQLIIYKKNDIKHRVLRFLLRRRIFLLKRLRLSKHCKRLIFNRKIDLIFEPKQTKPKKIISRFQLITQSGETESTESNDMETTDTNSTYLPWYSAPNFDDIKNVLKSIIPGYDVDDTIKLLEDLYLFSQLIFEANSIKKVILACITFAKLRLGNKPLFQSKIIKFIYDYFNEDPSTSTLQSGFIDMVTNSREKLLKWDNFKKSALYEKLSGLFLYLLSFVFKVNKDVDIKVYHIDEMRREFLINNYHMDCSFFYTLIDTVTFVIERGYQYFSTGNLDSLLHSAKGYENWYSSCSTLIHQYKISNGLNVIEPHGITVTKWLNQVEDCLKKGQQILKHKDTLDKVTLRLVRDTTEKLDLLFCEYINSEIGSKFKIPALGLLLYGDSSVGKSFLTEIIFKIAGVILGEPVGDEYKFVFTATDKFYTNLKSKKWFALFDEIAMLLAKKAMEDPSVTEPIRCINPAPYTPPQAELALKGVIPTNFKIVVGTTNVKDMNASYYFTCPSAVQRRFKYVISITVKPEYLKDGKLCVPPDYVPSGLDDFWIFNIEETIPGKYDASKRFYPAATYKPILQTSSIQEFVIWLKDAINDHFAREKNMASGVTKLRDLEFCPNCVHIKDECVCENIQQSGIVNATEISQMSLVCRSSPIRVMDKSDTRKRRIKLLKSIQPVWRNGELCFNCEFGCIGKDNFCKNCHMVDQCCHERCHWIGKTQLQVFEPNIYVFTCPWHNCDQNPHEVWPDSRFYYYIKESITQSGIIAELDPLEQARLAMENAENEEELRRLYKMYSRRFHPDRTGSHNLFIKFKEYYDRAGEKFGETFKTFINFNWRQEFTNSNFLGPIFMTYTYFTGLYYCLAFYLSYKSAYFCASKIASKFGKPFGWVYMFMTFLSLFTYENQFLAYIQYILINFLEEYLDDEAVKCIYEKSSFVKSSLERGAVQMQLFISRPKNLIAICAVLYAIKKAYELIKQTEQQSSVDRFAEEVVPLKKEINPNWFTEEVDTNPLSISPKSVSYRNLSRHKLEELIYSNTVMLKIIYSKERIIGDDGRVQTRLKSIKNHAFCIAGRVYAMNTHCFIIPDTGVNLLEQEELIEMRVINSSRPYNDNMKVMINPKSFYHIRKDLVLFEIHNRDNGKDLSDLLPSKGVSLRSDGFLCCMTDGGDKLITNLSHISATKSEHYGWMYKYDGRVTVEGDCGSPLVAITPSSIIILGIHGALNKHMLIGETGTAIPLYREDFQEYLEKYDNKTFALQHKVIEGKPFLEKDNQLIKLYPVVNSTLQYRNGGHCLVYGSLTNFKRGSKSRVVKTVYHQDIIDLGYTCDYGAPVLKGYKPHKINLDRILDRDDYFDIILLRKCRDACIKHFVNSLPDSCKKFIHIIDEFTAINGKPGVSYIDAIKKNTSAGFPFNKSKLHFMERIKPQRGVPDPYAVQEVISARLNKLFDDYSEGVRYCPVFKQHLKDEVRSIKKILANATRSFTGSPIEFTIAMRQFFSGFVRLVQNYRYIFCTAVGIDCTTSEWNELYLFFTKYKNYGAGDFSKFDQCQGISILMTAFEIMYYMMYVWGNMPKETSIYFWCFAWDVISCYVDYNGDLLKFLGYNPSGNPLTVIINGFVNLLLHIYCWSKECEYYDLSVYDFFRKVFLMTYGDDSIFSTDQKWFNQILLRDQLRLLNIDYTMADKSDNFTEFIPLEEVTFLKRSFFFLEELNTIVGPLDKKSIIKSLLLCLGSKQVSLKFQCKDILGSAIREFFFYGREEFESWRSIFNNLILKYDLSDSIDYLPTFDECILRYKVNSEGRQRCSPERLSFYDTSDPFELDLNDITLTQQPIDSLESDYDDSHDDPQGSVEDSMSLDEKPSVMVDHIPSGIENYIGEMPKASYKKCTVLTETQETAGNGTPVTLNFKHANE